MTGSALRLRAASGRDGMTWVREGFAVFARQPLGFAAVFAICGLGSLVLASVPAVGWIVLVVVWPAASLVFMIASRRAAAGERAMPGALSELAGAGRQRLFELLKLGVCYFVIAMLGSLLAGWLDGGAFASFIEAAANAQKAPEVLQAKLSDPAVRNGFILRLTVTALLSIPFWHAPALVFWGRQGWAKSLFFSTVAIWRNGRAFLVYGFAWAAIGIGFALLLGLLLGLLGPAVGVALAAPMMMIVWTIIYASLWFTFIGCFSLEAVAPSEPPAEPS